MLANIWVMDREGDCWREPRPIGPSINGSGSVAVPSIAQSGIMYFTRTLEDGWDGIFRLQFRDGEYQEPERHPDNANTTNSQFHSSIAPDESYLILPVYGREDSFGSTGNYMTFRASDDVWSDLIDLGMGINSAETEAAPSLAHDGRFFFIGSQARLEKLVKPETTYGALQGELNEPGNGSWDIRWVDVSAIEGLRRRS